MNLIRPRISAIHFVDHNQRKQVQFQGLAGHKSSLRHRPLRSVYQQHDSVYHPKDPFNLATEVGVARRVDNIDLHIVPMDGGVLSENGYPPLFLKRIRIHHPLLNRLIFAEDSRLTEHLVD